MCGFQLSNSIANDISGYDYFLCISILLLYIIFDNDLGINYNIISAICFIVYKCGFPIFKTGIVKP